MSFKFGNFNTPSVELTRYGKEVRRKIGSKQLKGRFIKIMVPAWKECSSTLYYVIYNFCDNILNDFRCKMQS